MEISALDALVISLIGIAIVFAVLAILMCVIMIMGLISDKSPAIAAKLPKFNFGRKKKDGGAAAENDVIDKAADVPLAAGTCGELVLVRTEERDAAMIMAIIADELDTPLNELRFKSIRRVDEGDEVK